ncbi:unnamed protein product [Urochloa humidicola]
MATTKQTICYMILILLVFASAWEPTAQLREPECWNPPDKTIPCFPPWEKREACKNECIQEKYIDGACALLIDFKNVYGCMCRKANCP